MTDEDEEAGNTKQEAVGRALAENDYHVFLAEAEAIGFTPSGAPDANNDLYAQDGASVEAPLSTILGQFRLFEKDPESYARSAYPNCLSVRASELYGAHPSSRIDPKYHIFKIAEEVEDSPAGARTYRLGELLEERDDPVVPNSEPDTEFLTVTLSQEGQFTPREAGKGRNPPSWRGAYFKEGQAWNRIHTGGILLSRIDLWKGCVGVVPPEFDGAIVTNEFPVYYLRDERRTKVDVRYLQLLLRTAYWQRAVRAITTGHSNRRRTQESDFENLSVFLPSLEVQRKTVERVAGAEMGVATSQELLTSELRELNRGIEEIVSEWKRRGAP